MSSTIESPDIRLMSQFMELLRRKDAGTLSHDRIRDGLQLIMMDKTHTLVWDEDSERVVNGVRLTRDFMSQTMELDGQILKRHPNGGGWVPLVQSQHDLSMPYVDESTVVTPFAMIYGNARTYSDQVCVIGNARVHGNAYLEGSAIIQDYANVHGDVIVKNHSHIGGRAHLHGKACVEEHSLIIGDVEVCGDDVWISNKVLHGSILVHGNVLDRNKRMTTDLQIAKIGGGNSCES